MIAHFCAHVLPVLGEKIIMKNKNKVAVLFLILALLFSGPILATSILTPVTDTVNSGIINTKMAMDNVLSDTNVDATVLNGIAVYSGKVHTKAQLNELVRIAYSVSGIKGVNTKRLIIEK